ncbi:hypothetical protein ACTL6U_18865 [Rhodovibrionaceae bacterium A322]
MTSKWRSAGEEPSLAEIYSDSLFAQILKRDRLKAEDVKAFVHQVQETLKAKLQSTRTAKAAARGGSVFSLKLIVSGAGVPLGLPPAVPLPLAG